VQQLATILALFTTVAATNIVQLQLFQVSGTRTIKIQIGKENVSE